MTCVVACKSPDGKIVIGADSAGSDGHFVMRRSDAKIVYVEGDDESVAFGYTTSFRMGQILRHHLKLPPRLKKDLVDWLVVDVVEAIAKTFKERGYEKKDKNTGQLLGGTFILLAGQELFVVEGDFQLAEPADSYCAVGSGEMVAYGALYALAGTDVAPEIKVRLALEAAAEFTTTVRGPFNIQTWDGSKLTRERVEK